MKKETFDVFIIGSGVAGQTAAKYCAKNNLNVGITEKNDFGGTCALRGCDPKKVILGFTEVLEAAERLKDHGIKELPKFDWDAIQNFKNSFTEPVPEKTVENLNDLGIKTFKGSPEFVTKNTLRIQDIEVTAKHIVIATGLIPRKMTIPGAEHTWTSDEFFKMPTIPERIVFIGAGYIGLEFAQMAARLGAQVTIIDNNKIPLDNFDPDMVKLLVAHSQKIGIDFIFNVEVTEIQKRKNEKNIIYKKNNRVHELTTTAIFNTTGRIPAIESLKLEAAQVNTEKKGIPVNAFLQSESNPMIYACGDVALNAVPLTPFSSKEGAIVGTNIVHGNKEKAHFHCSPSTVFTIPQVSKVGLSEKEARETYDEIKVKMKEIPYSFNAKRMNYKVYAYKTIVDQRTDLLLGAHLIGPEAAEMINIFTMLINHKITITDFKKNIFVYPSWCADLPYFF